MNFQDVFRRLNGCNRLRRSFLTNLIGRIYGSVQRRHRPSKPLNQPMRNKYDKYLWCCKYNGRCSLRGLAEINMSLLQYFRLLLYYRDILIYPNEQTMARALMPTNYFVVVLPSRQIKRVVRLATMNAVYLWRYFPEEKYGFVDYKRYHLIKLIKKERLDRLHPFNRLNTSLSLKLIYTQ